MNFKKFFTTTTLLLLGVFIFISGVSFGKREKVFLSPAEEVDLSLFSEVYYLLEKNFPKFNEVEEKKVVYGIINGALTALDDPHTSFFDPEKSKIFLEDVSGSFNGVGIEIGFRNGLLQVISPLKNTPAERAGIKSLDVIVSVDGESTDGLFLEEVVARIRGLKGTPVILGIVRNEELLEVEVVRETIKIPTVEWSLLEEDIAHIKLYQFNESIDRDFAKVVREITSSSAKKIILDLRGNPGGLFESAVSVSSRFLEPGSVVVLETGENGTTTNTKIKTSNHLPVFLDYPVVVLINEGSASASEIVAGALKDQRNIPIIGKTSFGKGSIQRLHSLSDGSIIKITEKYFLTPKGSVINKEGVVPDIEIEVTKEDLEEERDPQLEKALEVIKSL